jgi:hypothetical protein
MCGKPRRKLKGDDALTIQERKAALMEKYDFGGVM